MPTGNVVVTDYQAGLLERLVSSGRYQNASEVLREGLRLAEDQEAQRKARTSRVTVGKAGRREGRDHGPRSQRHTRVAMYSLRNRLAGPAGDRG